MYDLETDIQAQEDVIWMSWDMVMDICRSLARQIKEEYDPDLVVGIARAGVIPAAIVACALRLDFYPVRLSRRWQERVVHSQPRIIVPITDDVENRSVLIMDEMSDTGDTLRLAAREADKKGARKVKTTTLYTRSGSWRPTWYGFETDGLVVQPWDREVLISGEFQLHPDYRRAAENIEDTNLALTTRDS